MGKPQPLTLGMLISAIMRYDHGVFAPYFPDDVINSFGGPPEERIPKAIDAVISIYDMVATGQTLETVTQRQVAEEFQDKGFHSADGDGGYATGLDPYGMRELALARIGDRRETP